jgi:adenylate kinase
MVKDRLAQGDVANGFLLDGYPRNIGQADFLGEVLTALATPLDAVLELAIENSEIIKRLSGRRICRGCGASYHVEFEKPAAAGICDKCGGELYQRDDDQEAVIANRLNVYSEQTAPIVEYYRNAGLLKVISALGDVSEISALAISTLG